MRNASFGAALFAAASVALARGASAGDLGNPRAIGIVTEPGNEDDIVVRSDALGFFRSTDRGTTWQFVCSDVYGQRSFSDPVRVALVVAPGGRILVASASGLYLTDDLCNWRASTAFSSAAAMDISIADGALLALYVPASSTSAVPGQLWRSTDNGDSWSVFGSPLPSDFYAASLTVVSAPSSRIYVAGESANGGIAVEVSDNGAETWKRLETGAAPAGGYAAPRIVGVDPKNDDLLFLWNDAQGIGASPDEIWFSTDGGAKGSASWSKLFQGMSDLPGFALSPDSSTLLIAGQYDGIYSAQIADVVARGGSALQQVYTGQAFGLDWLSTGELYVGGNDFDAPYCTLCTSSDSGHSLKTTMNLCAVSFPDQCGADSTVARLCKTHGDVPGVWDAPLQSFEEGFLQGPLCVGPNSIPMLETDASATTGSGAPDSGTAESGAPIDGGVGAEPSHSTRFVAGCGCELPLRGGASGYTVALSLLGLLVGARWRRRREARRE